MGEQFEPAPAILIVSKTVIPLALHHPHSMEDGTNIEVLDVHNWKKNNILGWDKEVGICK